jgi:hypothetical protein
MKLRYPRIVGITCSAVLLYAILAVPAGAYSPSAPPDSGAVTVLSSKFEQNPTPTAAPTTTEGSQSLDGDPASTSVTVEPVSDTGDAIRERILSTAIAGAAIAASTLLLLWVYVTLSDPVRRHRTSMRIKQLRREERRDRARRRQRQ